MGCICGKPSAVEASRDTPSGQVPPQAPSQAVERAQSQAKYEVERRREKERERERAISYLRHSGSVNRGVPKAAEGEHVAVGWPQWLAAVAGEAIRGWVPRRADSFEKLDKASQGTYSSVYRARDLNNNKIVALKKVRFDNWEPESVKFMAREILVLRRLDHPNIIKLEGLVTSRMSCSLYLVFEYMEHDLAELASFPGQKLTEPQIKCYMLQLLRGLDHCHSRRILHRDIKGSNLLIDNNGVLKIADFGLASFFDPEQKHPLTSRVVTLWYRPPELLLGATSYGVAVDLWSTGCILAELYAGKPIMPGRTEVEQLHKIFKLCGSPSEEYWTKSKLPHATTFKPQHPYRRCVAETFKDFPPPVLALVDALLSVDPADRGTVGSALKSEYFMTKPYALQAPILPKYTTSKDFDVKKREEDFRRQSGMRNKVQPERQRSSRAVPAPEANAELASSLLKRQASQMASKKSQSEMFKPNQEESASGFPIEPQRNFFFSNSNNRASHSGPLANPAAQQCNDNKVLRNHEEYCLPPKRDPQPHEGLSCKKSNIHYSGPLVGPSTNVDQMLKDHDSQIQQVFRRSRAGKSRARRIVGEDNNVALVYPSSNNTSQKMY
ncbi:hypothetical protein LUZ60_009350 [Juncus effusus]|nr:hypothetical protein LUZ60_009350 [Juncus effusus]